MFPTKIDYFIITFQSCNSIMTALLGKKLLYDVVVYHDRCSDGMACKWIIQKFCSPTVTYVPICSGGIESLNDANNLSGFEGNNVIFVDIAPTIEQFKFLKTQCNFITVIDHHLSSLDTFEDYADMDKRTVNYIGPRHNVIVDMKRAAGQMVWDYFYPFIKRPWMIDYIGDRDLYKFELEHSREINLAMFKLRLINMTGLTQMSTYSKADICELAEKGAPYLAEERLSCIEWGMGAEQSTFQVNDVQYNIWSLNCPPELRSCVGNFMCETKFSDGTDPDFTLIWRQNPDETEYWISLRGVGKHNLDTVARSLDITGGGHFDAAGLTLCDKDFSKFVKFKAFANFE
jgi:hypothetical protein